MSGEAELAGRARADAAALHSWHRLQDLKPAYLLPVSGESVVDEREADLIRRVLPGDAAAYDGILTPLLPMAWRLAYSQLRDRGRADDCVQEAAVRGGQRLENLEPEEPFRPHRGASVPGRLAPGGAAQSLADRGPTGDSRALVRSSDDDWLERSIRGAELRRAFASLPRDQQMAVYLHLVEDLPQEEVAETLGTSLSNVKSRIL